MVCYWLSVFLFSSLGMFLFPVYGVDTSQTWIVVFALGLLLAFIPGYRTPHSGKLLTPVQLLPFLLPVAAGVWAFRFPYSLGLLLLGAGFVLASVPAAKRLYGMACTLVLSGLILSVQAACVIPYCKIAARYHEAPFFTPLFYSVFKLLGVSCSYSQDTLFVQTSREVISLVTSWEKLGLFFFISFFLGALVLIYLSPSENRKRSRLKKSFVLCAVLVLYSLLRYIVISVIFVDINIDEIYWEPLIITASYLPLPFVLAKLVPLNVSITCLSPSMVRVSRRNVAAGLVAFCFGLSLTGFFWFHDPGRLKKGRVLIDEYYSDWEWTEKELNTTWYGIQSVYNYYNMARYLRHYYRVETLHQPLTDEVLAEYDVFIAKTPTKQYPQSAMEAMLTFANSGGGLFMIGDHTNVFGTTDNLNPLAKHFGIRFNYDATYNLRTNDLHYHEHNMLFRHPALHRMPYFLFATSCSMEAPLAAEDVMTASNLKTMHMDFSRGGYFPDKKTEHNYTYGLFLQTVGMKYGKGRVLAFSDSTCFSNFYMHIPGKPEYVLGSVNWLNRENRFHTPVKLLCLLIMTACLGCWAYMSRKSPVSKTAGTGWLLSAMLLGLSSGALLCNAVITYAYTPPVAHTPFKQVGFENTYCSFRVPDKQLLHNPQIDYHTFYVWTQRLGYVPTLFSLQQSNLAEFDIAVFVRPVKSFAPAELKKIDDYISAGGRVLVVDHPMGRGSTARQILDRFGISISYDQHLKDADVYDDTQKIGTIPLWAPVEGGTPLLFSADKKPFIATREKGRGMITAVACSPSFTNKEMGKTETVPDDQQRFLYRMEFWILSSLMEKKNLPFSAFTIDKAESEKKGFEKWPLLQPGKR